jgi:hypothetical protein
VPRCRPRAAARWRRAPCSVGPEYVGGKSGNRPHYVDARPERPEKLPRLRAPQNEGHSRWASDHVRSPETRAGIVPPASSRNKRPGDCRREWVSGVESWTTRPWAQRARKDRIASIIITGILNVNQLSHRELRFNQIILTLPIGFPSKAAVRFDDGLSIFNDRSQIEYAHSQGKRRTSGIGLSARARADVVLKAQAWTFAFLGGDCAIE